MTEPDIPAGVRALLTRTATRRRNRTDTRAALTERRNHGLKARHARKLART